MAQAIWTGSISFGLVNIPVTMYSAEKKNELSFHLLDRHDLAPVHYSRVNERTGAEVAWEDVVRGHEYEDNKFVVLTDDDFRAANSEATQTIDILDFVAADEVDPVYYRTPYYLEPSKAGRKAYALLRETLRRTGRIGIAKVVIRTREHLAALIVRGPLMVLNILRFAHELRDPAELDMPLDDIAPLEADEKELRMAEQLVEAMVGRWEPEKYHDDYRDDLMKMIRRRIKAGDTGIRKVAEAGPAAAVGAEVIDIMSLLKRSVEQVGGARKAGRGPRTGRTRSAGDNAKLGSSGRSKTGRGAAS